MGDLASSARAARLWFWGLLALAVGLRLAAFDVFAAHHPDEVLQYLEPAYRLLTGDGIVTWEYRYGMRGWLLPWLLVGPMALGQAIGGSALAGIVAARLAVMAVAMVAVVAAWTIGRRTSPRHGIVAMAVMAIWYEQIYWSAHLLTETLATALFLGAAALVDDKARRGAVIAGGALLALAVVLRFHYAVAAGVFLLLAVGLDWRRWGWLIAGALPVVAVSGLVDLAMGQWPFEWVWTNLRFNVVESRSARFGVQPRSFYVDAMWQQWRWFAPVLLLLAVASGRRYRPLLIAAVFTIAVHSVIAHKEYRFIMLPSVTIVMLAGIGSVQALAWIEARRGRAVAAAGATVLLIGLWAGTSAWLGRGNPLDRGFGERFAGPALSEVAGRDARVCGLGIMAQEYWQLSRAYVGRPLPIFLLANTPPPVTRLVPPGRAIESINAVIAPPGSEAVLAGFAAGPCRGEGRFKRCLYRRPGLCVATPEADRIEVQRYLTRIDM